MSSVPVNVIPRSTLATYEYVCSRRERAYARWELVRTQSSFDALTFWDASRLAMIKLDGRLLYC